MNDQEKQKMKKKYALAGASSRAYQSYVAPLLGKYADTVEFAGIYDVNPGRSEIISKNFGNIPVYLDFDEMLEKEKPDAVIVTTVDAYHSDYVIRSMEFGCEVVVEKPLTIDAEKCRAILEAEKQFAKKVTVIFNLRYTPFAGKLKELVSGGAVGEVYNVHFEWLLDRVMAFGAHGASYFRRWNSRMAKSGGLLLHKCTHHFDFVNWLIGANPKKVSAFGKLNVYGKNGAYRGENCRRCDHAEECPFYCKLSDFERQFYAEQEKYDGYYKDGCVFSDEIDIYDTVSLNVLYDKGQTMSYSLNAAAAYEGWRMSINGSKGRLEAFCPFTGFQSTGECAIKIFDLRDNMTEIKVSELAGDHGGADDIMRDEIFGGDRGKTDPLGRAAGIAAGVNSLMIGAAANISIKQGTIVDIDELLKK
ncbi:MAG: Gfo/Idh/MocA family oxidoreductase [Oscillospiraceae bacterium]|nr:Gfo/Idh/MocA family oxidoreductase [Oscillospiraceae bacterium]